jgi:beta-lactam-binding protein with PASTA domain
MAERLDGKYEVLRDVARNEFMREVEAMDASGKTVRLNWFLVNDPKTRANYHRYRTAIKNVASPLLLDAVSRPGAYYTVWEILDGVDAKSWLESNPRDAGFRQGLSDAAQVLESYGFALTDADFIALEGDKGEVKPALSGLEIADRSVDEIKALNEALLEGNKKGGKPRETSKSKMPVVQGAASATTTSSSSNTTPTASVTPSIKAPPLKKEAPLPHSASKIPVVTPLTPAKPKPRLTLLSVLVGVIPGLLALVGVAYFGAQAARQFLEPPNVTVPNVVGKTLKEAAEALANARLQLREVDGSDQSKVRGIILAQNPAPETTLTEQRIVSITVNRPRPLTMPNLAGKSLAEAEIALREAKLKIGRKAIVPAQEGSPRDFILGQNPPAETEVVRGQAVTLLVSGPRAPEGKTFIPDLTGLNFEDAKQIMKLAGLRLVNVKTRTANLPSNTVLEQSPAPDTLVDLEGDATLTVAITGNAPNPVIPEPPRPKPAVPTTPVPNTNNAGNDGSSPTENPTTPTNEADKLPNIEPQPSTQPTNPEPAPVSPGTTAPTEPQTRVVSFSYTVPADRGTVTLEIIVKDDDGSRTVFPPAPMPAGQAVALDIEVRGSASVTVLLDGQAVEVRNNL